MSVGMSQVRTVPPPSIRFMGMSRGKNSAGPGPDPGKVLAPPMGSYENDDWSFVLDLVAGAGAKAEAMAAVAKRIAAENFMVSVSV